VISQFKNAMNNQLLPKSFLSLKEDVFMIPGEDINVQFKAKKAYPTIFKLVAQLESQRDEVEEYEIN